MYHVVGVFAVLLAQEASGAQKKMEDSLRIGRQSLFVHLARLNPEYSHTTKNFEFRLVLVATQRENVHRVPAFAEGGRILQNPRVTFVK